MLNDDSMIFFQYKTLLLTFLTTSYTMSKLHISKVFIIIDVFEAKTIIKLHYFPKRYTTTTVFRMILKILQIL